MSCQAAFRGDGRSRRVVEPISQAGASHDPTWAAGFQAEALRPRTAIGPWVTGGIHHIGGTAVPGLDAKPISDIAVGAESLRASRDRIDVLGEPEYLHSPYREEGMHRFSKPRHA